MADRDHFTYQALKPDGRRVRGVVVARDATAAFEQLRLEGLAPVALAPRAPRRVKPAAAGKLSSRDCAELLSSLAELLKAGADIRTSLAILGARFDRSAVKAICQSLNADIAGGESLERAFAKAFARQQTFVASMVAAGEAAGDLPGGLLRSAEIITSRLRLRDQLVSVLAYPAFVFASSIAALFVILLFIVPSIAPLAEDAGGAPPASLAMMIAVSNVLRENLLLIALLSAAALAAVAAAAATGLLYGPFVRVFLDGPARRTAGGLIFGAFADTLGAMLAAGTPISDALRLALRSVAFRGARKRLEPVTLAVRQGIPLSDALGSVKGFPPAIVRLAAVGEASNTLGPMLQRGGKFEEEAAMRRIETAGRIAGPALIVFLGLVLGGLMAGLLSGLSQMGQAALG